MGRRAQVERLRRLIDSGGRTVLVTGDAGIGKTTIIEQALEDADRAVYSTVCDPLDPPIPNRPFLSLLPDPDDALIEALGSGDRDAASDMVMNATTTGILVIDDAQWIDQASAELAAHVSQSISGSSTSLIVSYDPAHSSPSLGSLVEAATGTERLEVPPLSVAEIAGMLPAGMDAQETLDATGGNALLVRETASVGTPTLDLRSIVLARFDTLTISTREIVEALAVSATGTAHPLLDRMHPGWKTNLAPAEEARLLSISPSVVRFEHELIRRVVLDEMTEMRRRFLHQRILEHLDESTDAAVMAAHAEGAGDVEAIAEAGTRAAHEASRARSHVEAVGQLRRILRYEHSLDETLRSRLRDDLEKEVALIESSSTPELG